METYEMECIAKTVYNCSISITVYSWLHNEYFSG